MIHKYKTSYGVWELLPPFSLEISEKILKGHISNIKEKTNLLKVDYKRQLSRVLLGNESYVVKEFRRPGPWWIFRPDYVSWKNGQKLYSLGIPVPKVYAWFSSYDRRGFIIMEDLGDLVIKSVLRKLKPGSVQRRSLIVKISDLAASIHSKKVIYGDMKLTNVILKDSSLFLVDMDKIKFKRKVKLKDRAYNLMQIILSFPEDLTEEELMLFLKTYARSSGNAACVLKQ
jgi:tRNA A-37 threonylcarbamoyl transferase component Bud32